MVAKNVCQYWNESENNRCIFWDSAENKCIKGPNYKSPESGGVKTFSDGRASGYPDCNRLGTYQDCDSYVSERPGVFSTCILPDPHRHVCNRKTGNKWQVEEISGYNNGNCDGYGTDTTCSGYSPYHMAFSELTPATISGADYGGYSTTGSEYLPYRLPFYHLVANSRAKISRCYWWKAKAGEFIIDSSGNTTVSGFYCTNTDDAVSKYSQDSFDVATGTYIGMCNGAKPECPGYTGVCWKYCKDEYMRQGDKIRAEQILELRYYMRSEKWTKSEFESYFDDHSNIWAWRGPDEMTFQQNKEGEDVWLIGSMSNKIEDFSDFNLKKSIEPLSEGTESIGDNVPSYPTLVRYLYPPYLKPIIRNQFPVKGGSGSRPVQVTYNAEGDVLEKQKFFEATYTDHDKVIIWGDSFCYNPNVYAFNLSDPIVRDLFPKQVLEFDSMLEITTSIYSSLSKSESDALFEDVYKDINYAIEVIKSVYPDKVYTNDDSSDNFSESGAFFIPVSTFYGDNYIVVFSDGGGSWEYDKVSFTKILSNGVVAQTKFSVEGDNGSITYLPNFESNFMCDVNGGDNVEFEFKSFKSKFYKEPTATPYYVYNDSVVEAIPVDPANPITTYDVGYELYKVNISDVFNSLEDLDLIFFGNAGYCMLRVPDPEKFYNVHGPSEIEGINLYVQGKVIPMEVMEIGTDRIEVDQVFLKPKNIGGPMGFKRPCKNDVGIDIDKCNVYVKTSFEKTVPEGHIELVRDPWLPQIDTDTEKVIYKEILKVEEPFNENFTVNGVGNNSFVVSVIYRGGISGLVKGVSKTKMLTWVRQPYCRDVEIKYSWYSPYQEFIQKPENICNPDDIGEELIGTDSFGYTPWCGDHELDPMSGIGPMWYPYHACESYDVYRNVGPGAGPIEGMRMEVFDEVDDDGDHIHGSWDMRMLGPNDNKGMRGEGYASIWACSCDFKYYNYYRQGINHFNGYGKIRCGIPIWKLLELTQWGGQGPQFGNHTRDFMRTFRSFDSEYYYYIDVDSGSYRRLKKWMPIPYQYGFIDLTTIPTDYPFRLYCSNDYTSVGGHGAFGDVSNFVHPFTLLLADSIENVDVGEEISNAGPVRVRYEDILEGHSNIGWINYPRPREEYFAGDILTPVKSWYTYKKPVGAEGDVQFVWRERWKPLERNTQGDYEFPSKNDITVCHNEWAGVLEPEYKRFPYSLSGSGFFKFLDIKYPDYLYSSNLDEHRLVCDEGTHTIYVHPPIWADDNIYFWLKLDDGAWRPFDLINNTFDPSGSYNVDNPNQNTAHQIYVDWKNDSECSNEPHLWDIEFADFTEALLFARNNNHYIEIYDDYGDRIKKYYQRGINIFLDELKDFLPSIDRALPNTDYELKYALGSPEIRGHIPLFSELYPSYYNLDALFDVNRENYGEIELHIKASELSSDAIIGLFSKVFMTYTYGTDGGNNHYHVPAITISVDDSVVYSCDTMIVATKYKTPNIGSKNCVYTCNVSSYDIFNTIISQDAHKVTFRFRFNPTPLELETAGISVYEFYSNNNYVKIDLLRPYTAIFIEGAESINVYERLYRYSIGKVGDAGFPPYKKGDYNLLTIPSSEGSTVYQHDDTNGIRGVPGTGFEVLRNGWKTDFVSCIDKHRGRFIGSVFEDEYALSGNDIKEWETYQKKIYDSTALQGSTSFYMTSTLPPDFDSIKDLTGIEFSPDWVCEFKNTLILELSQVAPQDNYNPCGHKWVQKLKTVSSLWGIGGLKCADRVWRDTIVQYWLINPCLGGGWFEDLFTAYANLWKYILKTFAESDLNLYAPNIQTGIGKYWANVVSNLDTPPKVDYNY